MNEFINTIIEKYDDLKKHYPDQFNILNMNENNHTKFLKYILDYQRNDKYIFLESFYNKVLDIANDFNNDDLQWIIQDQKNNIDCILIARSKDKNEIGIIIENKINGASDQNDQLKRYIASTIKNYSIPKDKVYVVYLTLAGGTPNECSIKKNELENLGKRYKEISYKNEILFWVENYVLPEYTNREEILTASTILYIDYLKNKLRLNNIEFKLITDLLNQVNTNYNYDDWRKLLLDIEKSNFENREKAHSIVCKILFKISNDNIFVDETDTAYNLKWILKQDPTPMFKNTNFKRDLSALSIGYFTYCGSKFIRLQMGKYQIHMNCNFRVKKEKSAYLLNFNDNDWNADELLKNGFYRVAKDGALYFKIDVIPSNSLDLIKIANKLADMVELLKQYQINK